MLKSSSPPNIPFSWTDRTTFNVYFSVWGNCVVCRRNILERLQHRSLRIITNCPYDAPAEPLLNILALLSVNDIIYQESASMMYKDVYIQAPIYLTILFNRVSSVTNRSFRNSELNIKKKTLTELFCTQKGHGLEFIIWRL